MSLRPINRHIIVRRDVEILELWGRPLFARRPHKMRTYRIATGRVGLETPAGDMYVHDRARHPSYTFPDSSWVLPASLRGQTYKYSDERNPIVGHWFGLGDKNGKTTGIGIHGTRDRASILEGTLGSHGCVRMLEEDVKDLWNLRVPKGTLVTIQ